VHGGHRAREGHSHGVGWHGGRRGRGRPGAARHGAGRPLAGGAAAGRAAVDSFIAELQPGTAAPFEAQYVTTGSTARKIVYAVRPPGELMFQDTALVSGRGRQIVVNGSGEYLCLSPGHARWTCRQLDRASAAAQNETFGVYTPAHWAAFLKAYVPAPGARVTTFTTSANLPGMNCLDFSPPGTRGIDVVCVAAPGILGLVTFHATAFMIESFDPSPPASLFGLPPGAKVTGLNTGQK
jgi:hypothetical protein